MTLCQQKAQINKKMLQILAKQELHAVSSQVTIIRAMMVKNAQYLAFNS